MWDENTIEFFFFLLRNMMDLLALISNVVNQDNLLNVKAQVV